MIEAVKEKRVYEEQGKRGEKRRGKCMKLGGGGTKDDGDYR